MIDLTDSQHKTLMALLHFNGWAAIEVIRSAGGHAASLPSLIRRGLVERHEIRSGSDKFTHQVWRVKA